MRHSFWKLTVLLTAASTAVGCFALPKKHNLPPAQMMMEPGPGVGGPGPGVISGMPPVMPGGYGGYMGGGCDGAGAVAMGPRSSQVFFVGPAGTNVQWETGMGPGFDSESLVTPGRQNFSQGAIYRMKLTKVPGRPGVELYPTVEVAPANPRTEAFLAHNPIPVQFTEEDLDQVASSNYVTKVIYVPDPEFQELAIAGVDTLVSTRLDPGVDPIAEADRRGSIIAIVRLGNIDLEVPSMHGGEVINGIQQAGFMAPPGSMVAASYRGGPMGCATGGYGPGGCGPGGYAGADQMALGGPSPMTAPPIAGVNVPDWGLPYCGTPIGLPGPPHVPLGVQAGLVQHSIVNRTRVHLPQPVDKFKVTVKQSPGMSYPKPPSHMRYHERSYAPGMMFRNPFWNKLQQAPSGAEPASYTDPNASYPGAAAGGAECSDGECVE